MLTRALIVLLLVLNIGVALWWSTRALPESAAAGAAPEGVARLQLVAEGAGSPAPERARATAAPTPTAAGTGAPRVCISLGPFDDPGTAGRARALLETRVLQVQQREAVAGPVRGWNVLLPRFASLEAAQAAADRVRAAGFSDYFVVREGPNANSLALGRYTAESSAKRRVSALTAAGFPARAEPIGAAKRYWLDVSAATPFDANAAQAQAGARQQLPLDCAAPRRSPAPSGGTG